MVSHRTKSTGDALSALLKVDQDVFGAFPGGFGDNPNGDDHEDDHQAEDADGRSQARERADQNPSSASPSELTPNLPVNITNDAAYLETSHHHNPAPFDSNNLHEPTISVSSISAAPTSVQQVVPNDPVVFSALDDAYGMPLASDGNLLPSDINFNTLSMGQNIFHEFDLPHTAMDFYFSNDQSNFAYMQ